MKSVLVRDVEIGTGNPKICVPLVGTTQARILAEARECSWSGADLVEWRGDYYEDILEIPRVLQLLGELRDILYYMPLIFTFRSVEEGGERSITPDKYQELLQAVLQSNHVDLIDIQLSLWESSAKKIVPLAKEQGVKVIISSHDFRKTPSQGEIVSRLCTMQILGADIIKMAVMPQSTGDVITLMAATAEMTSSFASRPVVTMSMGELGRISRVSGYLTGSAITFGAVGKESAPGQLKVNELRRVLKTLGEEETIG